MNWMGGARSRIKASSDKKKQREFFEKRKRLAAQKDERPNHTNTALSGDLISFYLTQRNLMKNIQEPKPTKIIKQDLDNHSSMNGSKYVNLPQLPPKYNGSPPKDWKRFSKSYVQENLENGDDSGTVDEPKPFRMDSSPRKQYSSVPDMNEIGFFDEETRSADLEKKSKAHHPPAFVPSVRESRILTPSTSFPYPNQTPDINEAFKKYVYVDRFHRLKEQEENYINANIDLDADLHKSVLEKQFRRDLKISRRGMEQSTCRKRSKAKSRLREKMDALLSSYETKEKSNSMNSLSQWSKHHFASVPRKVTRDVDRYSFEDMEHDRPESGFNSDRPCRDSLNELEEMIEATALKQRRERDSGKAFLTPEPVNTENTDFSPTDSASSSSPSLNIPNFFKRKRSFENSKNGFEHDRNVTASYKKFCATVTDRKAYDTEDAIINCQRTIKISRREFLDPEENNDVSNEEKYKFRTSRKPSEIEKQLLPSSLLTYFPTPKVIKSEKCSLKIIQIPKSPTEEYSQEEYSAVESKRGQVMERSNGTNSSTQVEANGHASSKNGVTANRLMDSKKETNSFRNENGTLKRKVNVATSPFPCFKFYTKAKNVETGVSSPIQFVDEDPLKPNHCEKSVNNTKNSGTYPFRENVFGDEKTIVQNNHERYCSEDGYYDLPPTVPNSPACENCKIDFTVPETPTIDHNHTRSFSNGSPIVIVNETPIFSQKKSMQSGGNSLEHSLTKHSRHISENCSLRRQDETPGTPSKKIVLNLPEPTTKNVNVTLTPEKERLYQPKLEKEEFLINITAYMNQKSQEVKDPSTAINSSQLISQKENPTSPSEKDDNTIPKTNPDGVDADILAPVGSTVTTLSSLNENQTEQNPSDLQKASLKYPRISEIGVQASISDNPPSPLPAFEKAVVETSQQSTQTATSDDRKVVKFDKGVQTLKEEMTVYCQTLSKDMKDSYVQTSPKMMITR